MYRLSVCNQSLSPVKEPAVVVILKRSMGSLQQIPGILFNKPLAEPRMPAYHGFRERRINLQGNFLKLYSRLVIFSLQNRASLQDHLDDKFMCHADTWRPDYSHGSVFIVHVVYVC